MFTYCVPSSFRSSFFSLPHSCPRFHNPRTWRLHGRSEQRRQRLSLSNSSTFTEKHNTHTNVSNAGTETCTSCLPLLITALHLKPNGDSSLPSQCLQSPLQFQTLQQVLQRLSGERIVVCAFSRYSLPISCHLSPYV